MPLHQAHHIGRPHDVRVRVEVVATFGLEAQRTAVIEVGDDPNHLVGDVLLIAAQKRDHVTGLYFIG